MKKVEVKFETKAGNTYMLKRPTVDERMEILGDFIESDMESKKTQLDVTIAYAKACLSTSDLEAVETDEELFEIGGRAGELSTLGK